MDKNQTKKLQKLACAARGIGKAVQAIAQTQAQLQAQALTPPQTAALVPVPQMTELANVLADALDVIEENLSEARP